MKKTFTAVALVLPMLLPCLAQAADYLSMSAGYYDIGRMGNDKQNEALSLTAEWRPATRWAGGLVAPFAGGMLTTDGGLYGYGGVGLDFHPTRTMYIFPNFAAGLYSDGDGKDLGHAVEFRTGVELGWELQTGSRVGVAVHHISNAGLGDKNPGTEILSLNYSFPIGN